MKFNFFKVTMRLKDEHREKAVQKAQKIVKQHNEKHLKLTDLLSEVRNQDLN